MRLRTIFILYCLCFFFAAVAAPHKKAGKYYNQALHYKSKKQVDKACKMMELAIRKDPTDPDAYSLLGQWYFEAHRFSAAAELFKKASAHCKNGQVRFAKPLAQCLLSAGQPGSALGTINNYATQKDSATWARMRADAYFIQEAQINQYAAWPINMGIRVNTTDPELFPSVAADTQELYFTRRVNNQDEDIFMSRADSCGGWFKALNMGEPLNSPDQESTPFVSADGHYLFFTRCENRSSDGWTEGGCDLFMAYRTANDSEWSIGQRFGATINTPDYEGMPALSPDNRELYFVSNRKGGYGGYDIWISRFEDGLWQDPVNAGPAINTAGNETAPYMNIDNQSLYFTSDGWPGMGGTDLFLAKRGTNGIFSPATNLGYPINTACDEKSECAGPDGKTLYFASDRQGPAGNYDLYQAILPNAMKPAPVVCIQGCVYDSISKLRLNYAAIRVINLTAGDTSTYQSNRGDASYLITLHMGCTYAIHTARINYTDQDDTIIAATRYLGTPQIRNINIVMLPSDYVRPINDSIIATINFDVNRVELTDSEKVALHAAIAPWTGEKAYIMYVNAYTDNTGTPMINEELSTKRANMIAKTLMGLGIDETSIRAKGWGEAHMIYPNDTEEGRRKNRRVEIVIIR